MQLVVNKFLLEVQRSQQVEIPVGGVLLSVREENSEVFLFAMVDPAEKRMIHHVIEMYATGDVFTDVSKREFLGTYKKPGYVTGHAFVRTGAF